MNWFELSLRFPCAFKPHFTFSLGGHGDHWVTVNWFELSLRFPCAFKPHFTFSLGESGGQWVTVNWFELLQYESFGSQIFYVLLYQIFFMIFFLAL